MSKEAYYFSHDSNARNDEKILAVRLKHGMEGYGVYFAILERMREEQDYMCPKAYDMIAFELRVSTSLVKSIVEDFRLFSFTGNSERFYSDSFLQRMRKKEIVSKSKSENGKRGAQKRWSMANAIESDGKPMANAIENDGKPIAIKGKESKRKKIKKENINIFQKESGITFEIKNCFTKPTVEEVTGYCASRKNSVDAERFFNFYESKGWYIGKNKMKDWRAAVRTWEKTSKPDNTSSSEDKQQEFINKFK